MKDKTEIQRTSQGAPTVGPRANGGIAGKAKGTFQLRGWDECLGEEP
jgi:hypothetical protein